MTHTIQFLNSEVSSGYVEKWYWPESENEQKNLYNQLKTFLVNLNYDIIINNITLTFQAKSSALIDGSTLVAAIEFPNGKIYPLFSTGESLFDKWFPIITDRDAVRGTNYWNNPYSATITAENTNSKNSFQFINTSFWNDYRRAGSLPEDPLLNDEGKFYFYFYDSGNRIYKLKNVSITIDYSTVSQNTYSFQFSKFLYDYDYKNLVPYEIEVYQNDNLLPIISDDYTSFINPIEVRKQIKIRLKLPESYCIDEAHSFIVNGNTGQTESYIIQNPIFTDDGFLIQDITFSIYYPYPWELDELQPITMNLYAMKRQAEEDDGYDYTTVLTEIIISDLKNGTAKIVRNGEYENENVIFVGEFADIYLTPNEGYFLKSYTLSLEDSYNQDIIFKEKNFNKIEVPEAICTFFKNVITIKKFNIEWNYHFYLEVEFAPFDYTTLTKKKRDNKYLNTKIFITLQDEKQSLQPYKIIFDE